MPQTRAVHLVASRAPKPRATDFAFTKEGEPVTLDMPCGMWEDGCGCERSFGGTKTRKATTVARVVEGPGTDDSPLVTFLEAVALRRGTRVRVTQDKRRWAKGELSFRVRFHTLNGKLLHEMRVK